MLVTLKLPPGLFRNGTTYQARGRWFDANLIRFHDQTIRPMGGWIVIPDENGLPLGPVTGTPRTGIGWQSNGGQGFLAIGTHSHLFAYSLGVLTDLTPVGLPAGTQDATSVGQNYGEGFYGVLKYGQPTSGSTVVQQPSIWSFDTFGDYLLAVRTPTDGTLYYWNLSSAKAEPVVARTGAVPEYNLGVVVTPERYVVALGADGDVRRIRWASQETLDDWEPTTENTAGAFTLEGQGRIVDGRRGKGETLIWTDFQLFSMQFIGQPFVYRVEKRGDNCGLLSQGAVASFNGMFAWIGTRGFYLYDGSVRSIPCDVVDYVFSDFNYFQRAKVSSFVNAEFSEVWWLYPSAASLENDRYVAWNYQENVWTIGKLDRTCGIDTSSSQPTPIMCSSAGIIYEHETGYQRLDVGMAQPIIPFLISGPLEISQGERLMHLNTMVPDERTYGDVEVYFRAKAYPDDPSERIFGPYLAAATKNDLRVAGRQVQVLVSEKVAGDWRLGDFRFSGEVGEGR